VAGVATGVGDVKNGVTDEGGVAKWAKVSAKGVVPYIQPMLFRLTEHSIMLSKLKDVEKAGVKYATGAGSNSLGKKPTAISLNNKVANVELGGSMAIGGIVGRYAPGGIVGNGAWNMDSVRARYAGGGDILLAGGEGVINAAATSMIGPSVIDLINRTGRLPDNDNGRYFDTQNRVLMAGFRALIDEVQSLRDEVRSLRAATNGTTRAIERKPVAKVAARRG
ncbi:MAG: hypothetical protein J0H08_05595, partial [Rhizobiales bacterium]|nr:hypothetical protein [Hyphomicrobiales bacterium]